jgi:hypothetical protein
MPENIKTLRGLHPIGLIRKMLRICCRTSLSATFTVNGSREIETVRGKRKISEGLRANLANRNFGAFETALIRFDERALVVLLEENPRFSEVENDTVLDAKTRK